VPQSNGNSEELRSLVCRAQAGDVDAYGAVVRRFQDMALAYGYAVLGDFHLAEDAAQEAFVQAYTSLPALRDPGAFAAWFRRIALKHCDRIRRRTRAHRVRSLPLSAAAEAAAHELGPAEVVEAHEVQDRVHAAIRALPPAERTATALFYVARYSQEEVAAFLGVPVSTVNNRLHAARKRLQRSMLDMVRDRLQEARPSNDAAFAGRVLRTLAPTREEHSARIYDALEARTTGWGRTQWRDGRLAHSHFDWATSRVGLVDDRVVTIFGVYDLAMRIGAARVRTAGVNLEFTDPDYRANDGQNAFAETAAASVGAMREQGYDLSITFGSEAFFARLGYTFGWRELLWFVQTRDLPPEPPRFDLQPFDPVHRDDLAALYNREHETLTGTAVRPTYLSNKHPGDFQGYLWTDPADPGGAPTGYVSVGPEPTRNWRNAAVVGTNHRGYDSLLWHDESAGDPEERLRVLGKLARDLGCAEVAFSRLHYLSPLGRRLRRMRCRIELAYRAYVVKIVNLRSLFEKLAPELARRLAASHLAGWSGALLVASGDERVALEIDRGQVRVAAPRSSRRATGAAAASAAVEGGPEIAQLIVGSEAPHEVVEAAGITLRGAAGRLLEVLFPAQHPQMDNQSL
jgi:RNA polymerase sigma factor (sigma-70 family)